MVKKDKYCKSGCRLCLERHFRADEQPLKTNKVEDKI